ncbi:MAG: sugar phosphate isomerase/epimerase [Clostridia bacterium]|nr:sugar phosphate isomerase/epimerase [Clostridia bacterium]
MKTGVTLGYNQETREKFQWCVEHDIPTCQLSIPLAMQTEEHIQNIRNLCAETGMEITSLIGSTQGPGTYNFRYGPVTLGMVPAAYRGQRFLDYIKNAETANALGVPYVNGHMGFIPENPGDPIYTEFLAVMFNLANRFAKLGVGLNFETGQETPVTLLRVFEDLKMDNLGLNYDPANLLMYGKANPIDGLDIVGRYVRSVHAKDGLYPTEGYALGKETRLGDGRVNFPVFVAKLKELGYDGALTIEREISGEQQREDVLYANRLLLDLINA